MNDYIAAELRAELGRQRMSISELARRMEVEQSWLNKRLTGIIPLRFGEVYEIASLLKVPLERFVDSTKRAAKAAGQVGLEFGVFNSRHSRPFGAFSIRAA